MHYARCLNVITGMETLHPDFNELGSVPPELVAHVTD